MGYEICTILYVHMTHVLLYERTLLVATSALTLVTGRVSILVSFVSFLLYFILCIVEFDLNHMGPFDFKTRVSEGFSLIDRSSFLVRNSICEI